MVWYNHPYFEIRLLSSSKIGFVVQKKSISHTDNAQEILLVK